MTQHTPGPWTLEVQFATGQHLLKGVNGASFARLQQMRPERKEANARLIASAPELLNALKQFVDHATAGWEPSEHMVTAALATIAKAEGRDK